MPEEIQCRFCKEGISWLKKAFATKGDDSIGAASNACMLAIGEAELGNRQESERWLKIAEELDGKCRLLARAAHKLEERAERA